VFSENLNKLGQPSSRYERNPISSLRQKGFFALTISHLAKKSSHLIATILFFTVEQSTFLLWVLFYSVPAATPFPISICSVPQCCTTSFCDH